MQATEEEEKRKETCLPTQERGGIQEKEGNQCSFKVAAGGSILHFQTTDQQGREIAEAEQVDGKSDSDPQLTPE